MKKFLLIAVMMLASSMFAYAEYSRYYVTETVKAADGSYLYCIRIDWQGKLYELEGDGNEGEIRNFKETGNQRTFDVWFDEGYGTKKKVLSVVFTTDTKDTFTITLTNPSNVKQVYKLSLKDPHGGDSGSSVESKLGEKAGAIKNAIGKGVNKGLDALKKKREDNKAKKEAKKNSGEAN